MQIAARDVCRKFRRGSHTAGSTWCGFLLFSLFSSHERKEKGRTFWAKKCSWVNPLELTYGAGIRAWFILASAPDADPLTHRVILRGSNAVTGFPRLSEDRSRICIFRVDHYPRGNRQVGIKAGQREEKEGARYLRSLLPITWFPRWLDRWLAQDRPRSTEFSEIERSS